MVLRPLRALTTAAAAPLLRASSGWRHHDALLCVMRCAATANDDAAAASAAWSYEQVDAATGRTPLEELYEQRLQRIRAVFDAPLPPLPRDGNVHPDFLVGFAHYQYRLRDQYRAVLARSLGVPLTALRLSVAWSGRFDVARFNHVQKVCGVCITAVEEREELQQRIQRLVRAINARQSEALLGLHIVQAAEAIPEVEFAAAERDTKAAERVLQWMRAHILKPHLVVVLYGANSGGSVPAAGSSGEVERQRVFIEEKWVKAMHRRRVVPRVLSFVDLTKLLQEAVQRGEVDGIGVLQRPSDGAETIRREKEGDEGREATASGGKKTKEADSTAAAASSTPPPQDDKAGPIKFMPLDDEAAWHALLRKAVLRRHADGATLPLLFVHGECAGGVGEMRYLLHNREALDALLLHPNDVAFKKKFMSRFRASHSRLRMAEEMSA